MDILLISKYILIAALVIFMFAAVRIVTHRTVAMGLIGCATFSLATSVLILIVGDLHNVQFYREIALSIILRRVVRVVAYGRVLRRELID